MKRQIELTKTIGKGLLGMYLLTIIFLLLLALLMCYLPIGKKGLSAAIVVVYVLVGFLGGVYIGKKQKRQRGIWGAGMGCLYVGILMAFMIFFRHTLQAPGGTELLNLFLCATAGMAGGALS